MIPRKYGAAATVNGIPLIVRSAADFGTFSLAAGDIQVSKDGGAFANIAALPTAVGNAYNFTFTAAEMTCKQLVVQVIDQTNPKAFEDQIIRIETFGNANAQNPFDLSDPVTPTSLSKKLILLAMYVLGIRKDADGAAVIQAFGSL